jgi:hypothetical protein
LVRSIDWLFIAVFSLMFVVPWGIWVTGLDPRFWSMLLGAAAFFGLMVQLVSTFPDTTAATRAALALLAVILLFGAIGQYDLAGKHAPLSNVAYVVIGHRVGCIILACYWRRWLYTTRSPLLKPLPAVPPAS